MSEDTGSLVVSVLLKYVVPTIAALGIGGSAYQARQTVQTDDALLACFDQLGESRDWCLKAMQLNLASPVVYNCPPWPCDTSKDCVNCTCGSEGLCVKGEQHNVRLASCES